MKKKSRILTKLDEDYVVVGMICHVPGFNTSDFLMKTVKQEIVVIAPKMFHSSLTAECLHRNVLTPQMFVRREQPRYEYILHLFSGVQNGLSVSTLYKRKG